MYLHPVILPLSSFWHYRRFCNDGRFIDPPPHKKQIEFEKFQKMLLASAAGSNPSASSSSQQLLDSSEAWKTMARAPPESARAYLHRTGNPTPPTYDRVQWVYLSLNSSNPEIMIFLWSATGKMGQQYAQKHSGVCKGRFLTFSQKSATWENQSSRWQRPKNPPYENSFSYISCGGDKT